MTTVLAEPRPADPEPATEPVVPRHSWSGGRFVPACVRFPAHFDADPENPAGWTDIAHLRDLCFTCPLLADCTRESRSHGPLYGVVAGVYRPWPPDDPEPEPAPGRSEQVEFTVREHVLGLPPGTRLPSVAALCDATGCSRRPVRRVLAQLETEGVITRTSPYMRYRT